MVVSDIKKIKRYYDRLGILLDSQVFYERAAVKKLIENGDFGNADAVFELGCGTGRFAEDLLKHRLKNTASYWGVDVSQTMVDLTRKKLAPWGQRARVMQADGKAPLGLAEGGVDRFVSNYVFDLMGESDIQARLLEAHRLLRPGGLLCLISLTEGDSLPSRLVSWLWTKVNRLNPMLLGGCRPIRLLPRLEKSLWKPLYHGVIKAFSVPSEVVVAERL